MGALPKNKITRAERGKRRRGNTPTITKDTKVAVVRSHKSGFMAELLAFIGMSPASQASAEKTAQKTAKAEKKAVKKAATDAAPVAQKTVPSRRSIAPANKTKRQTQHKG